MLSIRRSSSSSKQVRTALAILVFARRLESRVVLSFPIERKSGFIFVSDCLELASGAAMRCGTAIRPQLFGVGSVIVAVNLGMQAARSARPRKRFTSGMRDDGAADLKRLV